MRFAFRLLSMLSLAVAIVMAVVDATRSIAAAQWTFTPLASTWQDLAPESFAQTEALVRELLPMLWDPAILFVLSLPGWVFSAVLASLFHVAGHVRQRRDELSPAR